MPGFDGTGPMGYGSMTGWGQGPCGRGRRGFAGRRGGAGYGAGSGRGRRGGGFGWQAAPMGTVNEQDNADYLRRRAEVLEEELAETRRVLSEMEADSQE